MEPKQRTPEEQAAYDEGRSVGYAEGYDDGHIGGYEEGYEDGQQSVGDMP